MGGFKRKENRLNFLRSHKTVCIKSNVLPGHQWFKLVATIIRKHTVDTTLSGRKDINTLLLNRHEFDINERHLKRFFHERGLSRHKAHLDLAVLVDFIQNQLKFSRQIERWSWMYAKCRECSENRHNGLIQDLSQMQEMFQILLHHSEKRCS